MKKAAIVVSLVGLLLALGTASVYAAEKPAAMTVTITGEVIDTYCYALAGAKGEGHRKCAIDCIQKGIPAGLLDESGKVYVLLPNKDRSALPKEVIDKAGRKATITGKMVSTGGTNFLTVESVK